MNLRYFPYTEAKNEMNLRYFPNAEAIISPPLKDNFWAVGLGNYAKLELVVYF